MRSTVHLVTARDCLALRPLVAPMLERQLMAGSPWGKALVGMDLGALVAAGRELVEQQPRTNPELARCLEQRFPERDGASMAQGLRNLLPLVQLPPRGIWGAGGVPTLTTAESWIGAPLSTGSTLDEMVLRYLAAFGPASVRDAQTWCGVTRLGSRLRAAAPDPRDLPRRGGSRALRPARRTAARRRHPRPAPLPARVRQRARRRTPIGGGSSTPSTASACSRRARCSSTGSCRGRGS